VLGLLALGAGAALIGGLVGAGELLSRYRDRPEEVLARPGLVYVALNAAIAAAAFTLIRVFAWRFGVPAAEGDSGTLLATQLLVAGFGSVALFRSSLFTVRVGDQDIGIGPSALLTVALGTADRAVDRQRGLDRSSEVRHIMDGVSFEKAADRLPTYCFEVAMQNVSEEEQREVGNVVNRLRTTTVLDDEMKVLILGAALLTVVGRRMLEAAVVALGDRIRD
jgi:hypothetical protein